MNPQIKTKEKSRTEKLSLRKMKQSRVFSLIDGLVKLLFLVQFLKEYRGFSEVNPRLGG